MAGNTGVAGSAVDSVRNAAFQSEMALGVLRYAYWLLWARSGGDAGATFNRLRRLDYAERPWRSVTGRERVGEDLIDVAFVCRGVHRLFVSPVRQISFMTESGTLNVDCPRR